MSRTPSREFSDRERRDSPGMQTATKILLGMVCLLLTDCTPRVRAVVIRTVTVVDVINGSLRGNQTVLVAGNHITAVGPADQVRIPDDADVLDAPGGFLIPGLWDMHVHSVANVAADRSVKSVAARDWHFSLFLAHATRPAGNPP